MATGSLCHARSRAVGFSHPRRAHRAWRLLALLVLLRSVEGCSRAPAPSRDASTSPLASSTATLSDPLRALALAPGNLCELRASGRVSCAGDWPINTESRGSFASADQTLGARVGVTGLGAPRSIAIANNRGCDIEEDGTVRCWGNTHASPRGFSGATPRAFDAEIVPGIDHVTALAITSGHSCALRADHTVVCWGPPFGGSASTSEALDPPRVVASEAIAQMNGGDWGTYCAATVGGTVVCWGADLAGGPTSDVPRTVPGLGDVAEVGVALDHACARTRSGDVLCWGKNGSGQLGDPSLAPHESPVRVDIPQALALAVSSPTTCALTVGARVYCWGADIDCVLGDAKKVCTKRTTMGTFGAMEIGYCGPTPVALRVAAKHVAVGGTHACGWDDAGLAECWGRNPVTRSSACTASAP